MKNLAGRPLTVLGSSIMIMSVALMLFCPLVLASVESVDVGVKVGDWEKTSFTYTGTLPADHHEFAWMRLEVTNITGALVSTKLTRRFSNGTETNETVEFLVGFISQSQIIPANSSIGDAVLVPGSGAFISEESNRTYCGAERPVLKAASGENVSYWDKQTGIMVESSEHGDGYTIDALITETNMWTSTQQPGLDWRLWLAISGVGAAAVICAILLVRRRK